MTLEYLFALAHGKCMGKIAVSCVGPGESGRYKVSGQIDARHRFGFVVAAALPLVIGSVPTAVAGDPPERSADRPVQLAQASKKIVFATGIDATFAHYVVAVRKGFLTKYGLEGEIRAFDDGSVALDTLLTGQGDVGGTSELGGLARRARGGKLYVVASGAQSGKIIGLAAKTSIAGPADLVGKTIGFPKATGGHYFFARYAEKYGIDPGKMTIKNLQAPESLAALSRGDIDAIFLWEPWLSRITGNVPNTKILAYSGDNDVYHLNVYIYFSQRLVDDKELGGKTLKAIIEAAEWMRSNVDETARITAEVYKTTAAESKQVIARYGYEVSYPAEMRKNFESAAKFAMDNRVIADIPVLDEFLRPDIMRAADPSRVK